MFFRYLSFYTPVTFCNELFFLRLCGPLSRNCLHPHSAAAQLSRIYQIRTIDTAQVFKL